MANGSVLTEDFECPVCGYEAASMVELREHFEQRTNDDAHQEFDLNPKEREIIDEDSVGTPVGTPAHPGIDEGSQD